MVMCANGYSFFLQEHMNAHTGETPYKCQVCGREFREKVHLRQHKWTHSTEKFLCPVCGNHFNRKGNMTEHIKKYHSSNEEVNLCDAFGNVVRSEHVSTHCLFLGEKEKKGKRREEEASRCKICLPNMYEEFF